MKLVECSRLTYLISLEMVEVDSVISISEVQYMNFSSSNLLSKLENSIM